MKFVSYALRGLIAVILVQSLFFKFSGASESIYIFSTLGMEPAGRIGTGVIELIASLLLFYPPTIVYGAALALGTMGGAIMGHLTKLGVEVQGDHGLLFGLACTVLLASAGVLWLHRKEIPVIGGRF